MPRLSLELPHFAVPVLLCAMLLPLTAMTVQADRVVLHVSPDGDDAWTGRSSHPQPPEGPFATLHRARDEVRAVIADGMPPGGVVVEIAGGMYELEEPLELGPQDSGTVARPVVYQGRRGEEIRLSGGRRVTGWEPVTDPGALERMDPAARENMYQADLAALGITDLGQMRSAPNWNQSEAGLEFFFNGERMTLARWPNEGFAEIKEVVEQDRTAHGMKGSTVGRFVYEGDRPERWVGEPDIMAHGYWWWEWADQRFLVESIDTEERVITLDPTRRHVFGFRPGGHYYVYNLLPELTRPGEWYLDRETATLYFWPPSPLEGSEAVVSTLPSLVRMEEASNVTLRDLTLEFSRGTAITISDGAYCRVAGCIIRNAGSWGVTVDEGRQHGVVGCDIHHMGDGGVILHGGDRPSLTPAGHFVENSHIHHLGRWNPMYKPGVNIDGVGNRIRHCLINEVPHAAIIFGGNEHLIELNEMHSVVYHANDAGAMYAYMDWSKRGTVIRHNYIHHVSGYRHEGSRGIYLDNFISGHEVYGNILHRVGGVGRRQHEAVFVHGGRDNRIENNLFVDCATAVGVITSNYSEALEESLTGMLEAVSYQDPPWSERYPELVNIMEEDPHLPRGNVVARNISVGGRFIRMESRAEQLTTVEDNLVDEDPRFVDPAGGDYRLRPDSPAWDLGFEPIPVERIGLHSRGFRATWPVETEVRPVPPPPPPPEPRPQAIAPLQVPRVDTPPTVDGVVAPGEWQVPAVTMQEDAGQSPIEGEPASARLVHDGENLYVAITVPISDPDQLERGDAWGSNDGMEVCFRSHADDRPGPIFVVHGMVNGTYRSADYTDAPEEHVRRLGQEMRFAARVEEDQWTGEFAIPLAAAGMEVGPGLELGFNMAAFRSETFEWILWTGTMGAAWDLSQAGVVVLE